jgi:hypothetical protein
MSSDVDLPQYAVPRCGAASMIAAPGRLQFRNL